MRVDGLQDGGRVNNTQLIALFPSSWRKKKGKKYCHKQPETSQAARFAVGEQVLAWAPRSFLTATTRRMV